MKNAFILLILVPIFFVAGCSTASNNVLETDEFNVYEGDTMIATTEEFAPHVFSIAVSEEYGDYVGRDITTKRGIKLGSTSRELAEAYKGVPAFVLVGTTDLARNVPFNEVLEENSQELSNNNYSVFYDTYSIDGKLYDTDAFLAFLDERGIGEYIDYVKNADQYNEEYKITSYSLRFDISDNIVSEIQI